MQLKINRNKLFIGILAFLLVVNLLVLFDLNYFYIRATLAFIFIITVPGLLIMLMLKVNKIGFWEYLVYTIGLSVSFIMFAGLAVNWTLPWLGITNRPLDLIPIIISFDIFLLVFTAVAFYRNKKLKYELKLPEPDTTNNIFFIIPMLFPVLSILGALVLNNNGPNYLTMIMLGGIAIYVFMVVLYRDKLNPNLYIWALWVICIALVLMTSLRSNYITAEGDMGVEYKMFKITESNSLWNPNNPGGQAYNSCLSITVLPQVLHIIVNSEFGIFKIYFPLLLSTIVIISYLFFKRYLRKPLFLFLAGFFYILQSPFISWLPRLGRQEIAFIFFGLALLAISSKNIKIEKNKFLFVCFSFSIILSHYSTAYISIAIFSAGWLITTLFDRIKLGNNKSKSSLSFMLILLVLSFSFLWYSQLTETSNGLSDFLKKSVNQFGDIFRGDLRSSSAEAATTLGIFQNSLITTQKDLADYSSATIKQYSNEGIITSNKNYTLRPSPSQYFSWTNPNILNKAIILSNIIINLTKVFLLIGFILLSYTFLKKETDREYYSFVLLSTIFLGLILIVPYFSVGYNVERLYQQVLLVLSPLAVIGGFGLFKFLKKDVYKGIAVSTIFILYFLFNAGVIYQLAGGEPFSNLNNFGNSYYQKYTSRAEISSIGWLDDTYASPTEIFADSSSARVITAFTNNPLNIKNDILPQVIPPRAYVYLSRFNIFQAKVIKGYNNRDLIYNLPKDFLNQNKNKVYNNGGSEIFK